MLNQWLNPATRPLTGTRSFSVVDITELVSPSTSHIDHLKGLIHHARRSVSFLEAAAVELGWPEAQQYLANLAPTVLKMRRGMFGEVLSVGIMTELHDYFVPVQKLQSLITSNQSLPGTDAIAFRVGEDGTIQEVAFIESKLRTSNVGGAAVEGCMQLEADASIRYPVMLEFVAQRLHEQNHALSQEVLSYLFSRRATEDVDSFHVVVITDATHWTERTLDNLDNASLSIDHITVHAVRIATLAELVEKAYLAAGIECIPEDE